MRFRASSLIQQLLFAALGALAAALAVLLAAPAFRRKAERAARRKLEAGLPMSLEEIEAGKDALRAEFATSTLRFEQDAKVLRAERNEQAIAAGRALEEASGVRAEGDRLREAVAALENEGAALRDSLAAAENRTRDVEARLAAQQHLMEEAQVEAGRLEKRFEEASFLASSRQIDLVGRESEAERLHDELREARNNAARLERDLNAARSLAEAARGEIGEAAARSGVLQDALQAAEERAALARQEAVLFRSGRDAAEAAKQRLEVELVETAKERMELEVEFAALNRLLVSLFPSAAAGGSPAKALEAAATERDRLETRVAALLRENKELRSERADTQGPQRGEASADALLREQMLDLAAQVTALAARAEGRSGAIEKALDAGPGGAGGPDASLADRIRRLL